MATGFSSADSSEAEIFIQAVAPQSATLSPEVARAVLALKFQEPALTRMRELLDQNNQGTLTPEAQALLEKYRRVGQFLDLLQAKARVSLKASAKEADRGAS
jgi:hypothetical protein